jgi:hypothetical protein
MRSTIRARSKNKVGSLRSMKQWFAFRSLTHYALKQYERATHSRFPFTNVMGRVRECLTLMPGQSANADCRRAPGRHPRYSNVPLGGPFATPRTRRTSQVIERFSCIPTVQVGE